MPPAIEPLAARQPRTPHEEAFSHYLRTGERLTTAEWLARQEVKFNPWHDRIGRFTYGPEGVGGGSAGPGASAAARSRAPDGVRPRAANSDQPLAVPAPATAASGNGFRSDFVRGAVASQTSTADTYFELNKRQAGLDRLRAQAGPQPAPAVAADLAEFQARLDANRVLLDKRYRFADQQVSEVLRAGLMPYDVAAGATSIAKSHGELRDYLAVAGVVPVGAVISKVGTLGKAGKLVVEAGQALEAAGPKVAQLGGAHKWVKANQLTGYESHHLISRPISPLKDSEAPAVSLPIAHHKKTGSWGNRGTAQQYRKTQARALRMLGIRGALEFDARVTRREFGALYDEAYKQAEEYAKRMGYKSWILSFFR